MNNRQRMRVSNSKAVKYLIENGFTQIWLKSHVRRNDYVYCMDHTYKCKDVWNLLDGFCSKDKIIYGLQIKTNHHESENRYKEFQYDFAHNIPILLINVYQDGKSWKVKIEILGSKNQPVLLK